MKHQNQTVGYDLTASKFQWDIAPGKTVTAWGFNKQIPASTLKAKVGDTMIIRVKNELAQNYRTACTTRRTGNKTN